MLVGGGDPYNLNLYDTDKYQLVYEFKGHTDVVKDLKFSPDDSLIASVSLDKNVILWDFQ